MREEYVSPVGFAKEPSEERRRWIGRVFLFLLLVFIVWLLVFRVFTPFTDESPNLVPDTNETVLPNA
jgi:hypothetical protein